MATTIPNSPQMIITLEDNALVADIKRALKMIRGIASVRTATISDDPPEEMQRYFDSL